MPANPGASRNAADRVQVAPVEGAAALFTPEFRDYLVRLCDEFTPRAHALRAKRDERLVRALKQGRLPEPLPAERGHHVRLEGAAGAEGPGHPRHRDLGPVLDHQHVHQRAQPGAGGRARRGRPRRRRGLGRASPDRHGARLPQPARRGEPRAAVRGPRAEPGVPHRARRAAVLHAPRARPASRRARGHGGRPAGLRRDPRHRADALLPGPRPGQPRAGHLLLPAQGGRGRGVRLVPRRLRPEPRAPAVSEGRDDPRDPPRRGAARGLRDGGDAPRARARTRPGSTRPAGTSRRASSSS